MKTKTPDWREHLCCKFVSGTCLVGVSCAHSVKAWEKSGGERSSVGQDREQCQYEAKAETASYHSAPTEKGESAAIGDGIVIADTQIELTNATRACARGATPQ